LEQRITWEGKEFHSLAELIKKEW